MTVLNKKEGNQRINYFHITRQKNNGNIFIDEKDYKTFINFLSDYFSNPRDLKNNKKTFIIRGHTYKGLPHQTQNYFGQIDLLCYRLQPNQFDLLLKENSTGAIEKFIRSLSTRYAKYYNYRHKTSGTLFPNQYQSVPLKDSASLLKLADELHYFFQDGEKLAFEYSSCPEYLGQRSTPWVKPEIILNLKKNTRYKGEKYKNPSKSQSRIPEIIFASGVFVFLFFYGLSNIWAYSKKNTISDSTSQSQVLSKSTNENTGESLPTPEISPMPSLNPEILPGAVTPTPENISVSNITESLNNKIEDFVTNTNNVEQENTDTSTNIINNQEVTYIKVRTYSNSPFVKIYKNPSFESETVSIVKEGDIFEVLSQNPEWFEIKLGDTLKGFINFSSIEILEGNNQ